MTRAPSGDSSAPNTSVPSTLRWPSTRRTRCPTALPTDGGGSMTSAALRVHDGRDDLAVARAAAEDAAEPVHHLLLGGRRRDPQERGSRHQHARRADAALRCAVRQERRLQSAALAARVQPLERLHATARETSHRRHARAHRLSVEQNRARAAVAGVASDLGRREPEVVAQHVAQPPCRPVRLHRRPVHVERDRGQSRASAALERAAHQFRRRPAPVVRRRADIVDRAERVEMFADRGDVERRRSTGPISHDSSDRSR